MICVSFLQGEVCAGFFFVSPLMGRLDEVGILSADDRVCVFVLLAVQMRHPARGAIGGWVMPGLVFKWFLLCDFSLFDTPYA